MKTINVLALTLLIASCAKERPTDLPGENIKEVTDSKTQKQTQKLIAEFEISLSQAENGKSKIISSASSIAKINEKLKDQIVDNVAGAETMTFDAIFDPSIEDKGAILICRLVKQYGSPENWIERTSLNERLFINEADVASPNGPCIPYFAVSVVQGTLKNHVNPNDGLKSHKIGVFKDENGKEKHIDMNKLGTMVRLGPAYKEMKYSKEYLTQFLQEIAPSTENLAEYYSLKEDSSDPNSMKLVLRPVLEKDAPDSADYETITINAVKGQIKKTEE